MRTLAIILSACIGALPADARAQPPPSAPEPAAEILTLDEAIAIAIRDNRLVKDAQLDAERHPFRLETARSRRLPQFRAGVLAGHLLHDVTSTFPAGSFGTYATTGPIPATDAKVTTPARLTTVVTGAIDLPLLQQHAIGLSVGAARVAGDIAREGVLVQRQKVAADVRATYFRLVAAQLGLEAARDAVRALEEAQRVSAEHARRQVVLRADALEVEARLATSRFDLTVAEHGLATERERLNQLLARDLATPFRVVSPEDETTIGLTLDGARQRAAENRPELRQAALKERQADFDRRLAKADYIPDLSVSIRYVGVHNVDVVPANATSAGLYLSWEPFDWGRRRRHVAEKATAVAQARNGTQETRAQIDLEVGAKYRRWREAALLLTAARTAHEASVERARVMADRYREQAALLKDVLQTQAQRADARFKYQNALASYWTALADLHRAMGDE